MKIHIKGLNSCVMRKQKLAQYEQFFLANDHEVVDRPEASDISIIWTCGFRTDFRDGCLEAVEHFRRTCDTEIIVTGCLPDICPELIAIGPKVRSIRWKDDLEVFDSMFMRSRSLKSFSPVFIEGRICEDVAEYRRKHGGADVTFHDQFIKLVTSEGCCFKCTYCSERLAFPPFRSFPIDGLVEATREIVQKTSVYDVILMADSLGQYGKDIDSDFPTLVRELKSIHADIRFAFNNLNPRHFVEFIDEMECFIKEGLILHLNLPIQSGSDSILASMQREYSSEDLNRIFSLLNDLHFAAYDTHIIAGFPGETEDDFMETIRFVSQYRPQYVLTSRYMESLNAPSARLPHKVEERTVLKRLAVAEEEFGKRGIICNSDGSELSERRLMRLFQHNGESGGMYVS